MHLYSLPPSHVWKAWFSEYLAENIGRSIEDAASILVKPCAIFREANNISLPVSKPIRRWRRASAALVLWLGANVQHFHTYGIRALSEQAQYKIHWQHKASGNYCLSCCGAWPSSCLYGALPSRIDCTDLSSSIALKVCPISSAYLPNAGVGKKLKRIPNSSAVHTGGY